MVEYSLGISHTSGRLRKATDATDLLSIPYKVQMCSFPSFRVFHSVSLKTILESPTALAQPCNFDLLCIQSVFFASEKQVTSGKHNVLVKSSSTRLQTL